MERHICKIRVTNSSLLVPFVHRVDRFGQLRTTGFVDAYLGSVWLSMTIAISRTHSRYQPKRSDSHVVLLFRNNGISFDSLLCWHPGYHFASLGTRSLLRPTCAREWRKVSHHAQDFHQLQCLCIDKPHFDLVSTIRLTSWGCPHVSNSMWINSTKRLASNQVRLRML